MNRTIVCKFLESIHQFIEESNPKELEIGGILRKLLYVSDDIVNAFLIDNPNAASSLVHKSEDEGPINVLLSKSINPDDIEIVEQIEEKPFEELLEDAYDVLKTETKPGPTLVERKLDVKKSLANKLWKELIATGRIVKGQRAIDHEESQGDLSEGFEEVVDVGSPIKDLASLIADLPDGDNLLVDDHLKHLIALPEAKRAVYLTGINLADVVSVESVEEAALDGIDRTLVDQIIAGSKVKPKPVKNRLNLGDKSNPQMVKYAKLRNSWVKDIPNGKALYKHMIANGVNKALLSDLRDISQAIKSGAL